VSLAYRTNPRLLAQRANARSADYRYPAARSQFGPSLSVTGAYTFNRNRTELLPGSFVGAQGFTSTAGAVLNQPLLTFGRNAAAASGALAESQFARDSLRVAEADVLLAVVGAYVRLQRDANAVTIARQNLALLDRQYRDNAERFRVRDITASDLQQIETRVEFGRAQLTNALGQYGTAQGSFLREVGARPGVLAAPDLLDIRVASLGQALSIAEVNAPLVRAAQSREKVSRAAWEAAKAESRPRVDLQGSFDYGTVSPYSDQLRTTQVVGRAVLTQPIIDSGLRNARRNEAAEANTADWRLIDDAVRETHQSVTEAWNVLTAARASLANYRLAVDAAQRAYDGAQLQQKAGDRTTLDVLDLARDLLNIRLSYNAALADEYVARAALLAAMGQLEAPQLLPGLPAYDADAHFDRVKGKGDVPLLTPALAGLDGALNRDTTRDRPIRDAAALEGVPGPVPLQSPAPVSPAGGDAVRR
jgi:TolC family type I secretion outer membrane protein